MPFAGGQQGPKGSAPATLTRRAAPTSGSPRQTPRQRQGPSPWARAGPGLYSGPQTVASTPLTPQKLRFPEAVVPGLSVQLWLFAAASCAMSEADAQVPSPPRLSRLLKGRRRWEGPRFSQKQARDAHEGGCHGNCEMQLEP